MNNVYFYQLNIQKNEIFELNSLIENSFENVTKYQYLSVSILRIPIMESKYFYSYLYIKYQNTTICMSYAFNLLANYVFAVQYILRTQYDDLRWLFIFKMYANNKRKLITLHHTCIVYAMLIKYPRFE